MLPLRKNRYHRNQGDPTMKWQSLITLAREMAETPPSDDLLQTKLRLEVATVYYARVPRRARSNRGTAGGVS